MPPPGAYNPECVKVPSATSTAGTKDPHKGGKRYKRRPWDERTPYGPTYPWERWFTKRKRFVLVQGDDYYAKQQSMEIVTRQAAKRLGLRVSVTHTTHGGKPALLVEVTGKLPPPGQG